MIMANAVPVKGTSGQFAAMTETEIILKTDQEPAIEALMADVVKTRGGGAITSWKGPQSTAAAVTWSLREVCKASKD